MELCTELFYAIIPTLFLCFLLICHPYILLHFLVFFILVYVACFNSRWLQKQQRTGLLCCHAPFFHGDAVQAVVSTLYNICGTHGQLK